MTRNRQNFKNNFSRFNPTEPERDGGTDSWGEYRKLVIAELNRLNENIGAMTDKLEVFRTDRENEVTKIKVELAMLKVKTGIIGAAGGSVCGAIIAALVMKLMK